MALDNRGRLLELVRILEEHCGDKKGLTMRQIIDRLGNVSGD
jgi:hypothetical protein